MSDTGFYRHLVDSFFVEPTFDRCPDCFLIPTVRVLIDERDNQIHNATHGEAYCRCNRFVEASSYVDLWVKWNKNVRANS